ncbi:hypothetical protein ACFV4F_15445 [Kitasatospora sp. NPDC059722]|uniref:hypothetical protein n=1 Tax=Kitasatospora sp. NPDC059722 TaxID=3346925 RepID=UPI0036B05859
MYPLGLGVVSWWWLAILATAVFWVVLVPSLPIRSHQISTALAPVAMALFGLGSHYAKHMEPAAVLAMYSCAVVSIPLGVIGHRKELARRTLEAQDSDDPDNIPLPPVMLAQLFVSLVGFGALALWAIN